jgi:hypothetical protein
MRVSWLVISASIMQPFGRTHDECFITNHRRRAEEKNGPSSARNAARATGIVGHNPTDAGRWMYPRAADLTSRDSQSYSDQELFWIIKNGIRLSGMPAFGKVESDDHIWDLVLYVRALPKVEPQSKN